MLTAISCIAVAVYFEARGETVMGQRLVAETIVNRAADDRWPDNECDVVKQKSQFSFYSDGKSDKPENDFAFLKAQIIAHDALRKQGTNTGALWFHADYVRPVWRHKLKHVIQVGSHLFYTDK